MQLRVRLEVDPPGHLAGAIGRQLVSLARRQLGRAVAHAPGDAAGQQATQPALNRRGHFAENAHQLRRVHERHPAEELEHLSFGKAHVSTVSKFNVFLS